ncbi:hypothetical protein LINPERPRIM_LOCUS6069 [Linum perenne]
MLMEFNMDEGSNGWTRVWDWDGANKGEDVDYLLRGCDFAHQLWSSSWKAHRLGREASGNARQSQLIGWWLGGEGWFTLNSDRSLHASSAAAGGIIHDDQGWFVVAFASKLGLCSVVRAEMRGIVDGMGIVWDNGIRKLRTKSNSASSINLLTNVNWNNHHHLSLVRQF